MPDEVFESFLRATHAEAMALAAASDRLHLEPMPVDLPQAWIATFTCRGLVRVGGKITEADRFRVGIRFPASYLRVPANPIEVLTWLEPASIWHSNVRAGGLFICVGVLRTGTDLVSILHQLYEIITWQNFAAHDGLNTEACQWARSQPADRFPIDRRPLKRTGAERQAVAAAAGGVSS